MTKIIGATTGRNTDVKVFRQGTTVIASGHVGSRKIFGKLSPEQAEQVLNGNTDILVGKGNMSALLQQVAV